MLKKLGTFIAFAAILSIGVLPVRAADVPIFPSGPVYAFSQNAPGILTFGASGPGGFNNNFYFTPNNVNESVCLYFKANNLANLHTFNVAIIVTPDPTEKTPSDTFWVTASQALLSSGTGYAISGIGANVSGAAQVSLNFSNSAAPADTVQVTLIQNPNGACMTGTNFVNNSLQNVNSTTRLETLSDGQGQSYTAGSQITNPASGAQIFAIYANANNKSVFPDRLVISSTAAAVINFNTITTAGTGCTAAAAVNLKTFGGSTSISTTQSTCATTQPTIVSVILSIPIPASTLVSIDLRGFIAVPQSGVASGFNINMSVTLTGTITTNLFWSER